MIKKTNNDDYTPSLGRDGKITYLSFSIIFNIFAIIFLIISFFAESELMVILTFVMVVGSIIFNAITLPHILFDKAPTIITLALLGLTIIFLVIVFFVTTIDAAKAMLIMSIIFVIGSGISTCFALSRV